MAINYPDVSDADWAQCDGASIERDLDLLWPSPDDLAEDGLTKPEDVLELAIHSVGSEATRAFFLVRQLTGQVVPLTDDDGFSKVAIPLADPDLIDFEVRRKSYKLRPSIRDNQPDLTTVPRWVGRDAAAAMTADMAAAWKENVDSVLRPGSHIANAA